MSKNLNATWNPAFTASLVNTTGQNSVPDTLAAGSGPFKTLKKQLANGSGANQATFFWHQQRTVAGGVADDIDLMTMKDGFGDAITWTLISWFLLRLTAPAAGVKLALGNYGGQGWTGWFTDKSYTMYVQSELWMENQIDGWGVAGGERFLRLTNSSGTPVVYDLVLLGR